MQGSLQSLKTEERKFCEACNIKIPITSLERHQSTLMHKILTGRQNRIAKSIASKRQDNSQQMRELTEKLRDYCFRSRGINNLFFPH